MLFIGVLRIAVREHLNLIELVNPNDAPGVPTCSPCFTSVARRPAGVAQWSGRKVDNFAFVVSRERHLRGAYQIQVIRGQVVDLVGVLP